MCCKKYIALRAAQTADIDRLMKLYDTYIAEGDEYHAALTETDIVAANSLARLVHKHPRARKDHNLSHLTSS